MVALFNCVGMWYDVVGLEFLETYCALRKMA